MSAAAVMGVLVAAVSAFLSGWSLFYSATERRWIRVERLLTLADKLDDEVLSVQLRKDATHLARVTYLRERRDEVRMMRTFVRRSRFEAAGVPSTLTPILVAGTADARRKTTLWSGAVALGLATTVVVAWPGSKHQADALLYAAATLVIAGLQYYFTVVRGNSLPRRSVDPHVLHKLEVAIRGEAKTAWPPNYTATTD